MLKNVFSKPYADLYDSIYSDKNYNVLELGGACGANYFQLNHFLSPLISNWFIIETPEMVKAGKKFFENERVKFFNDLNIAVDEIEKKDLFIAQGVLQYLADPIGEIENYLKLNFANVYITRTIVGLNIDSPVITKQVVNISSHGPGKIPEFLHDRKTSQVLTILPYSNIIDVISKYGYKTQFNFDEGEYSTLKINNKKVDTKNIGILLTKEIQ